VADPEEERWIWVGFAKESRLLLRMVVSPRTQESADELIKGIDSYFDKNNELPLFVSDGKRYISYSGMRKIYRYLISQLLTLSDKI